MPTRHTVKITRSVTVRVDVPDGMSFSGLHALIQKSAYRLLEGAAEEIEMTGIEVTNHMVRESPRTILRVSDDQKRITDEEVTWAGEGLKEKR